MRLIVAMLMVVLAAPANARDAAPPQALDLVLKPHATGREDSHLAVTMSLKGYQLSPGDVLVRFPLVVVGIPTARHDGDALQARDDKGALQLVQDEEPPTSNSTYRRWKVGRKTYGKIVVSYRAPPRQITATTNNGPLFDLREEAGGFIGAGIGFLALPPNADPIDVRVRWDLADAPPGTRGVWSLGEGDARATVPTDTLRYSVYAVGPVKSLSPAKQNKFGLYWLAEPPFQIDKLGERIKALHAVMADFFNDRNSSYRVFTRQNPYRGTGGTAFASSFAFGYHAPSAPTVDHMQFVIAHEIAHNWLEMEGEPGVATWYLEGSANLYSTLLSHRGGIISTDDFLKEINGFADEYYTNPYLRLTNAEAAKKFWVDPIAQTLPYGRGFLYLVATDAAIRAASGGARSLDDVVLELRRRRVAGEPYGTAEWLGLVGREIGVEAARREFDAMEAGAVLTLSNRFAPCFAVEPHRYRTFALGFARSSLNDGRPISDLDAASPAAGAGVRNGDVVTAIGNLGKAQKDPTALLELRMKRGADEFPVRFLPRGGFVEGFRWIRNPDAAEETCQF
jgi:hypothetical protein